MIRAWVDFFEAFLTVEVSGLAGVMAHSGSYTWPTYPALVFITAGALLAGVRRVQAHFSPVPQ